MKKTLSPKTRQLFLEVLEMLKDKDTTDEDLGKILGVTQPCISQYRHGKRVPSIQVIIKLAQHTNIPIKHFLKNE